MRSSACLFLFATLTCFAPTAAAQGTPSFEVHEWGVWVVDEGRVVHMPDLAAACPSFVMRAPAAASARRPPRIRVSPVTVEKPVMFFHTDQVIENVRVSVRFRRGEPWLAWPFARFSRRGVRWQGRVVPRGQASPLQPAAERGRRHPWWDNLRRVGDRFEPRRDGAAGEDFLFYDGTMPFASSFAFRHEGGAMAVRRTGNEGSVWLSDGQRLIRYDAEAGQEGRRISVHPVSETPSILRAELLRRGLTADEAGSLVRTWHDDLLPGAATGEEGTVETAEEVVMPPWRAFYFVPQADYDRMLPLRIRPAPSAIVRVGLVIEMVPAP